MDNTVPHHPPHSLNLGHQHTGGQGSRRTPTQPGAQQVTRNEQPPATATAVDLTALGLGIPDADDRWQPTRAGAINTWAWADETMYYADGWLALVGQNGSGKSLTASMLVTVLLDADTSSTALSVTNKSAGTLLSRHTDRSERDDRTGVWWLEYGFRTTGQAGGSGQDGAVRYVTTGMWLRSVSGNLQKVFFIADGRVGHELTLQTDRSVVHLDTLAEQIASCGGEMFTDSGPHRNRIQQHLTFCGELSQYRTSIRTRLFAPLDDVQFDALIGVLRSLRSIRTGENVSAQQMRDVLTEALPALDSQRLSDIATSMQRIADLEDRLADTKAQVEALVTIDRTYTLYREAVAQNELALLRAANTNFDGLTRQQRTAERNLAEAEQQDVALTEDLRGVNEQLDQTDAEYEELKRVVDQHAGGEIPELTERVRDLTQQAALDEGIAERSLQDATVAVARSERTRDAACEAQATLRGITDDVRRTGAALGASSALDRLLIASTDLLAVAVAEPLPGTVRINDVQVTATPEAWVAQRTMQISAVSDALEAHALDGGLVQSAWAELRAAEGQLHQADHDHSAAVTARQAQETRVRDDLETWNTIRTELEPVPTSALDARNDDRLTVTALTTWLDRNADQARRRIDVDGTRTTSTLAASRASDARNAELSARGEHNLAEQRAIQHDTETETARQVHALATQSESEQAQGGRAALDQTRQQLDNDRDGVHAALREATRHALTTVTSWTGNLTCWTKGLDWLDRTSITIPSLPVEPGGHADSTATDTLLDALTHLGTTDLAQQVYRAGSTAQREQDRRIHLAEQRVQQAETELDRIDTAIKEANRAASSPPAPAWRTPSAHTGLALWALVTFRDDADTSACDRLEGALLVSGILDAVVTSDGTAHAGDLTLNPNSPAPGRSLADALTPEPGAAIAATTIEQLLRSIALDETSLNEGQLTNGVLTATAPDGYRAQYIGATARERARRARLAALQLERDQTLAAKQDAEQAVTDRRAERTAIDTETASLPSTSTFDLALEQAQTLQRGRSSRLADIETARAAACSALSELLTRHAAAQASRLAEITQSERHGQTLRDIARTVGLQADAAETVAHQRGQDAVSASRTAQEAVLAQERADQEYARFPDLGDTSEACEFEDTAADLAQRARAQFQVATDRHTTVQEKARGSQRALNKAATLPDGQLLPTTRTQLKELQTNLAEMSDKVRTWGSAARRSIELLELAAEVVEQTATARTNAERASDRAQESRKRSLTQQARLRVLVDSAGEEYSALRAKAEAKFTTLRGLRETAGELSAQLKTAGEVMLRAQMQLENVAPKRAEAEEQRTEHLARVIRLVDERVAIPHDDVAVDDNGRPLHITAALAWATEELSSVHDGRLEAFHSQLSRRLKRLESDVASVRGALIRFNRQVTVIGIEGTDWRRAEVASPDALVGEDLHHVVDSLNATAEQLDDDLSSEVKATMKEGLFTALRNDIALRRQTAINLVREIRTTLKEVRTGIARVGVEVDWRVKDDVESQRMVELITAKGNPETFERMYEVLRARMNETVGEAWQDRVAHAFDYRGWHEWEIRITHASFGDEGKEEFKTVKARSNPLDALSTGEKRLATMLPLLAAAWQMYSDDRYTGPRLLSIDEIDAAFDDSNLRQILSLLRRWKFDVLATAPHMTPMIKTEAQRVMIHEVVQAGRQRVTVPWLWEGHGEVQPLTLDLDLQPTWAEAGR